MKTSIKASVFTSILSVSALSPVMADNDQPPYGNMGPGMMGGYAGMGPGMMGGYGGGYAGMGPGMMGGGYGGMRMIQLSDSQIKQMQKIRSEVMSDMAPLMREMWQDRSELSKLMHAEKHDTKAIGEAYDKLATVKKKAFMKRIEIQAKMQSVLTKEQKEKMRNAYENMMMGY